MTQTETHTHHQTRDKEVVPRAMARALVALVLTVLVLVTIARVTHQPMTATPPDGEIITKRVLLLDGNMAGAARVRTADGALIADLVPEEGGFISGVWRVLQRERTKNEVPLDGPVELLLRDTGRLEIHDPSTGWHADLMAFGADNHRAFAKLLKE